jgi:hypothetical protein
MILTEQAQQQSHALSEFKTDLADLARIVEQAHIEHVSLVRLHDVRPRPRESSANPRFDRLRYRQGSEAGPHPAGVGPIGRTKIRPCPAKRGRGTTTKIRSPDRLSSPLPHSRKRSRHSRGPEGCDENGAAAALLVGYVSIKICALLAPCRRPILIATKGMLFRRQYTKAQPTAHAPGHIVPRLGAD